MRNFWERPLDVEAMSIPGCDLVINRQEKVALLFDSDPLMPDERYAALEQHLNKRGYVVQIIVAPRDMPYPTKDGK